MINYKGPIIVVAGLTASGKSTISLRLAKDIDGYIINGDSRQIYKELKIGTAQPKPDRKEKGVWYIDSIKHYLYGHVSVKENYNLYQYQKDVQNVLNQESKIPILVGGTGLYIDSIVYNYHLTPSKKEKTKYSREELKKMSVDELQQLIPTNIFNKLNRSDRNNPIRLIRAIERGGINETKGNRLNHIYLLLDTDLETVKNRIINRVDQMFDNGLLEENRELMNKGFSYNLSALQSIGYREFKEYFEGKKDLNTVRNEIVLHTVQYAKRQKTWFKRNKDVVKIKSYEQAYTEASNFLSI
jgi:tRNA dimethylallyltransferase